MWDLPISCRPESGKILKIPLPATISDFREFSGSSWRPGRLTITSDLFSDFFFGLVKNCETKIEVRIIFWKFWLPSLKIGLKNVQSSGNPETKAEIKTRTTTSKQRKYFQKRKHWPWPQFWSHNLPQDQKLNGRTSLMRWSTSPASSSSRRTREIRKIFQEEGFSRFSKIWPCDQSFCPTIYHKTKN